MGSTTTPERASAPPLPKVAAASTPPGRLWKALVPIAIAIVIALIPPPDGLAQHAWYFFAIFAGVIVGLMLEPLPGGAIGLIGVATVAVLAPYVLFAPAELAKPGFKAANASLTWALSGFSNSTVWLIFGAFMFALGYEKTGPRPAHRADARQEDGPAHADAGLRGRGRRHDPRAVHAVEHGAQRRHDLPGDPQPAGALRLASRTTRPRGASARTSCGWPSPRPASRARCSSPRWRRTCSPSSWSTRRRRSSITWTQWFMAFAPVGILLLIAIPLVTYWIYPPEVKAGDEVPPGRRRSSARWAASRSREIELGVLVLLALALWIFGGDVINATTVALVVICLMLVTGVVTWDDIAQELGGVEHAGVVRDAGRARRRPQQGRLREVVRRQRWPPHGRLRAATRR